MIKKLLLFIALFATVQFTSAQGTFSVLTSGSCYNNAGQNTFTATVFSSVTATSYSWTSVGSSCVDTLLASTGTVSIFRAKCCGTRTLTVAFYSGSTLTGTAVTTVNFNCPPTVNASFAAGNTVCSGTTNTLIATGAMSYTIAPGFITNGVGFTVPSSSTCYTVIGTSPQGCSNYTVVCLTVNQTPTVSIAPVSPLCLGQSTVLSASGANSYVWSTNATGSSILISPSATTCYSVIGSSSSGCSGMASSCVSVLTPPFVFAISNPDTICQGSPAVLQSGGAVTYTWFPTMISGPTATVYPPSTTVFTVIGYDGTCTATGQTTVTVLSAPVLMSSNSYSMCLGTSVTMTVSGASTYTWVVTPPVNTTTLNVMPTSWTMYTVSGTGANGCMSTYTVGVYPDPGCAIVWPGDANSDGVVTSNDVFELGLYSSSTGAARSPGGNSYTGQYATAWTGNGSNSQNKAHIDCNGDGTVDQGDTLAITSNFSMTHSFRLKGASSSSDDISLYADPFYHNHSALTGVNVYLGTSANIKQNIYGVAFDLHFDASFVEPGSAYMTYPSSFLDAGNQNIPFRLFENGQGVVHCVSVRTDGNNVSGFGKIATFNFVNVAGKTGEAIFSVQNVQFIDASGQLNTVAGTSVSAIAATLAGINDNSKLARSVSVYPNPAANVVSFNVSLSSEVEFSITDLTGRLMMNGKIRGHFTQDISSLSAGTYILNFKSPEGTFNSKLIKE